jgi:membrane-associated HD superfamily phosphohydrolase
MKDTLLALSDSDYTYWRQTGVLSTFESLMRDRRLASDSDVQAARASLPDRIVLYLGPNEKAAAIAFVSPLLMVNVRLDEEQTQKRREKAAENVKPVLMTVQKGEWCCGKGSLPRPKPSRRCRKVAC